MTNNKSKSKRFLAILLCVVMIVPTMSGTFGVLPSFVNGLFEDVPVEAEAATTYNIVYSDMEYHYDSGTTFINSYGAFWKDSGFSKWTKAKEGLASGGYTLIDKDMNDGASGAYIASGYIKKGTKVGTNYAKDEDGSAFRMIRYWVSKEDASTPLTRTDTINGHTVTFDLVGHKDTVGIKVINETGDGVVDFNKGAGGAYIYAYVTYDPWAGPPMTDLIWSSNSSVDGYTPCCGFSSGQYDKNSAVDMNREAGGDDIVMHYKSSATKVDSTGLRATMNTAADYLANSSRYTSASVSALQTAVDNAYNGVIVDLNTYAATTKTQTDINNYKNAIDKALDALETTVYFNATTNGGTTVATSTTVTVGTKTSGTLATLGVSGYSASKSGWEFLGWNTNSTATTASTSSVAITDFNQIVYAIFSKTLSAKFNYLDESAQLKYGDSNATIHNNETSASVPIYKSQPTYVTVDGRKYTFVGWLKGTAATATGTVSSGNVNVTATEATPNYYAVYSYSGIGLTFNGNKPTASAESLTGVPTFNNKTTIYINAYAPSVIGAGSFNISTTGEPKLTGYTFNGWTKNADGSGTVYKNNGTTSVDATDNITLYAKWTADSKTLTVEHYQMGLDGNYPSTASATTTDSELHMDETVTAANYKQSNTGFTYVNAKQGATDITTYKMKDTGNTIKLYYSRNQHSLTVTGATGTGTYYYGVSKECSATLLPGYQLQWKEDGVNVGSLEKNNTSSNVTKKYTVTMGDANKTLQAVTNPISYTVTFVYDNGDANTTTSYDVATSVSLPTPTKNGYDFNGWTVADTDANGSSGWSSTIAKTATSVSAGKTGNVTLTAQWTLKKYNLTLVTDGSAVSNITNYDVNSTDTLPATTKPGYQFAGWKVTTADGTWEKDAVFAAGVAVTGKTGSATLTATWTAYKYTLTFEGNGGTPDSAILEYTAADSGKTVPGASRPGYTLNKWLVTEAHADANDAQNACYWTVGGYVSGGSSLAGLYGHATMQATWTANTYSMTLSKTNVTVNGQTGKVLTKDGADYTATITPSNGYKLPDTITVTCGSETLTSDDYTYTKTDDSNASLTISSSAFNDNITVTVAGVAIEYDIEYTLDGGSATNPTTYTVADTITLINPTKDGYEFLGWTGSNGTTPSKTVKITKGTTGSKTYTANWSKIYTVTFAGVDDIEPITYTYESGVTIPATAKENCKYRGWKVTTVDADATWTLNDVVSAQKYLNKKGDITLTAILDPLADYNVAVYYMGTDGKYSDTPEIKTVSGSYVNDSVTLTGTEYPASGFTFDSTNANNLLTATIEAGGTTTLKLYYSRIKYKFTGAGSGIGISSVTATSSRGNTDNMFYYDEEVTVTANLNNGYKVSSWSDSALGTDSVVTFNMPASNKALTVTATVITYNVTFDMADTTPVGTIGASSSIAPMTYTVTGTLTLPAATRPGYEFNGWRLVANSGSWTAGDYTAKQYAVGKYGDLELVAVWTAKQVNYSVTAKWQKVDLSGYDEEPITATGYTDTMTVAPAAKEGFTCTNPETTVQIKGDGTTEVTYIYDRNSCALKIVNDGTTLIDTSLAYGAAIDKTSVPETPTKTGYTFNNWTNNHDSSTGIPTTMPAYDVTYTSKFNIIEGTITYVTGDGTLDDETPVEYNIDNPVTLKGATLYGADFLNWAVSGNDVWTAETVDSGFATTGLYGDVTLTANWDFYETDYTVNVYEQKIDGTYGDATVYENRAAKTADIITLANLTDIFPEKEGFTRVLDETSYKVAYHEGEEPVTVVVARYVRDTVNVTVTGTGNGNVTVTGSGTKVYGATAAVSATVKPGYGVEWIVDGVSVETKANTTNENTTFTYDLTIGKDDIAVVAKTYPIEYTIHFMTEGGSEIADKKYTVETPTFILPESTYPDVEFSYWNVTKNSTANNWNYASVTGTHKVQTGRYGDVTLTAVWKGLSVQYTVNVYQQNLDGEYVLTTSMPANAISGTEINATMDAITGFTANTEKSLLTGFASTTLVISKYYDRNKYNVSISADTSACTDNEAITLDEVNAQYYYEAKIDVAATVKDHYDLAWTGADVSGLAFTYTVPAADTVLKAVVTPKEYTVTYDNAGHGTGKNETYTIEDEFTVETPTYNGYTFNGWTVEKTDANWDDSYNGGETLTGKYGDVKLTASWTANAADYKVIIYIQDATTGEDKVFYEDTISSYTDTAVTFNPETVKDFAELPDKDFIVLAENVLSGTVAYDGTTVLFARYTRPESKLTVVDNGGGTTKITINDAEATEGMFRFGAQVKIAVELKDYYKLDNWSGTESTGLSFTYTMGKKDITFVANTSPEIFYLIFDENGGSDILDGFYTIGDEVAIPATTRAGYVLKGWTVTKTDIPEGVTDEEAIAKINNWSNIVFGDKENTKTYKAGEKHGSVKLTAVWEPMKTHYTVETYLMDTSGSYVLTGTPEVISVVGEGDDAVDVVHDMTVSTTAETIEGFTFVPGKSTLEATVHYSGSTVLKKYYSRNRYKLTVANEGNHIKSVTGEGTYYYGETVNFTFTLKDRCSLTNITIGETEIPSSGNAFTVTVPAEDTVISLNTEADSFDIIYDVNGGNTMENTTYKAGSTFSIPAATREGYTFVNWTLENLDSENNWTVSKISAGSFTNKYGRIKLKANWKANDAVYKVNVYYMNLDGTQYVLDSAASETIDSATDTTVIADTAKYAKTGFTLNTEMSVLNGTVLADNSLVLSVYYSRNKYAVTVSATGNGSEGVNGAGEYYYGQEVTVSVTLKAHYKVSKWNGASGTDASVTVKVADKPIALTVETKPVSYTATFINGEVSTPVSYTIEDTLSTTKPGKPGFAFDYWTVSGEDNNWGENVEGNTSVSGKYGNVTLTATYHPVEATYGVEVYVMDLNGEYQLESEPQIIESANGVTVSYDGDLEKTGFTVTEDSVREGTVTADNAFKLVIKFARNKHNVTVNTNGNGAENIIGAGEYYYGATVNIGFTLKTGYSFLGWEGTTETGTSFSVVMDDSDLEYTVKTAPITYTIDYDANGGDTIDDAEYTIEDALAIATPTRLGYIFKGWTVTGTDTNWAASVEAGAELAAKYGNVKLVANWEVINYTITYDFKGGTATTGYTETYTVEDAITLPTVSRGTDLFGGWKVIATGESNWGVQIGTETAVAKGKIGNVKLTAILNPTELSFNISHKVKTVGSESYTIFNMTTKTLKLNSEVKVADLIETNAAYDFAYAEVNGTRYEKADAFTVGVSGSERITLFYEYHAFNLSITYKYEDDSQAAETYEKTLYKNNKYLVYSPKITGFVPSIECVSGTISDKDVSYDIVYIPGEYTVTVHYRYNNGKVADVTKVETFKYLEDYSIPSKEIEGYEPSLEAVEGTMGGKDVVCTVVYSPKTYKITVNYLSDETNEPVANKVEKNVVYGAKYSVVSPSVVGYTAGNARVDGIMGADNLTVDVMYSRIAYVVRFYDGIGNMICEQSVKYGDAAVAPENPTRPDDDTYSYKFNGWDTKFTSIKADTDITAIYTKTRLDNGATVSTNKTMWQKFIEFFKRLILLFTILSIAR